ncbi:TM0106 family RecB-like putative nuclease [Corynebacterium tapiri]|uniref:TM0106 family RecB-like putative nuclease n=1 Tax=Corynebacterium tapiri TaxID=1448266 RepID=A0A5C4U2Y1_9CORY|nr:TM0106 family RecB-like putative nuclease [Corynebacterium tapiri]
MTASDLVGCRFRRTQRLTHPEIAPLPAELERYERKLDARQEFLTLLPTRRGLGDGRSVPFVRIDVDGTAGIPELTTLEGLAQSADLITGAVFEQDGWRVRVDALVKVESGGYAPIIVSNHRVARPSRSSTTPVVATNRLGLSRPLAAPFKRRNHSTDGYRLAMAARALSGVGLDSGLGGQVGQDRGRVFIQPTAPLQPGLERALAAGFAIQPRRLKECATCRFWPLCEAELLATDDISLVVPGDRARSFRERGITTVESLIDASEGEPSLLAQAWRDGIPLLKREPSVSFGMADVEIDVDMEAYLDKGAYLWGAFDGERYHGFATWQPLDSVAEAENFARFYGWLMQRRDAAHAQGLSFAAYCYSAHGENHWLVESARRFHGKVPGVPSEAEVQAFIASEEWVDVFAAVRRQLYGPGGVGLKVVAAQAGYQWADEDVAGEESVSLRRIAVGRGADAEQARQRLLRYNEDDTRATAQVRHFLRAGAPGIKQEPR